MRFKQNTFLIFVLPILTCLLLIVGLDNGSAHESGSLLGISDTQLSTPKFISPTPPPQIPVISKEEAETFIPIASYLSNPIKRHVPEREVKIQTLLQNPTSFDGYQVELQGVILKIQSLSSINLNDWKDGYVFTFDDGSVSIPVLYRGSLYKLENGVKVNLSGVFVADGAGIHADAVYANIQKTPWHKTLPTNIFTFGMVTIALAITSLVLLLIPRKKQSLLLFIFLMFILSACEIQIEHIIKSDGSVKASFQMVESAENVDFLRKLPGLNRYISTWIAQNRELGLSVENWVEGEREYFYIQQNYLDIHAFLDPESEDEEETEKSWVFVKSYSVGDETCYRYFAQVSPEFFYDVPEDTDAMISNAMEDMVDEIDMQYGVTLPGRLIYTNASSQSNTRALWTLNLKKANVLIAESCGQVAPVKQIDWLWVWIGLAGVALLDVSLWILVIRKYFLQSKTKL